MQSNYEVFDQDNNIVRDSSEQIAAKKQLHVMLKNK